MRNNKITNAMRLVLCSVALSLLWLPSATWAQSTANYTFSTNTTGSLALDMNGNTVDMSTGTTQLVASAQDATASSVTAIGFDFFLMGNRYSQFSASADGYVGLGGTVVSGTSNGGASTTTPKISAMGGDLYVGASGKVHYKMVGTAPNRCLVVEFNNMAVFYSTAAGNAINTYQVRLYETTGVVEFIYGAMYCGATTYAPGYVGFSVGSVANTNASITTSTNTVSTGATFSSNSYTATTNIANLNSVADGSRTVYRFTPPVPTAPSSLSFSSVAASSMVLNWSDNASNEVGYALYRSLDGVTYSYFNTVAANSVSALVGGLTASTLYYWKVYAITEGALSTPVLSGSQATISCSSLSGVKTVGAGGDYLNLTAAFSDINSCTLAGSLDLQLIAGYPAAAEMFPIQSSNTAAVGTYSVKVYPTVSGLSITSANTTGTLNLNNAKNLTFDGRVNQTGANDLIIANTNAGASYAILFNNDATSNTIQNCFVQSTNTSTSSGTIVFGTTTGVNGNDNNTVQGCDIRDGATTPVNAIYAVGTTTTAAQYNDNNVITNNNISNFFSAGSSTVGVYVGSGNSTWTISNNKLFQTATRTYTSANTHNVIQVSNTSGNGFVITGNTIGFASSSGTGVYTMTGTIATRLIGINLSVGTTVASSVQGNTISGLSLTTSSGATTSNGILTGINITAGNVNVGNLTANVIGAATGTGAISATTSTSGGLINGINSSSSGIVNISGNTIGSITGTGSSATTPASITGIQVTAGTPTISGNTIGSTTTANSINAITVATGGSQLVRGIDVSSGVSSATTIQSNSIANLTQAATTANGSIRGIAYAGTGLATISQNTISALSGANTNVTAGAVGVIGILHSGSATSGALVSGNTIYNLSATNTGSLQTNVSGITFFGPTAGSVIKNVVYDLRNASTMTTATTPPTATGITLRSVTTSVLVANNMISLGNAQTTNTEFIGIWNNTTSTGALNIYFNSVSISGTASSGALPTFGFVRGDNSGTAVTSTVDVRNNIFSNLRSGGTGKHYAIANQSTAPSTTGWGLNASNFNVLNTANAATVGLWGAVDAAFNPWRVAAASDATSLSAIPLTFVDETTGNLHLNMGGTATPIESGATPIATVTTDIDAQSRPGPSGSVNGGATAPDLGADEFDGVPALPVITLNSVTPPTSTQCTASPRLVSVTITTPVGTIVSANIGYTVNGVAQTPIAMTNTSGNIWEGTIPAPTPVNALIAWGVSATNSSALSGSYTGTSYSDEPLFVYTPAVLASSSVLCNGSSTDLSALLNNSNPSTLYSTPSITSPTTDEDLRTVRITQGGTTLLDNSSAVGSLTGTIGTASGTAGSYSDFTSFGSTTLVGGQTYTLFVASIDAVSSFYTNYATAFIDFNRDGDFADAGESLIPSTGVLLSAATDNGNDSISVTFTVPATAVDGVTRLRVSITETGQTNAAGTLNVGYGEFEDYTILISNVTSVSWSDGVSTIGSTNSLTVTPTTTTTYTATITAFGCTVAPTVTVTVNPLPTVPTATNSTQCGTQMPTASVASTSGLSTPTFNWYSATVAGTLLQTSTSTTYTTAVTTTTTFYVSELNATTGCESARVPVTVTVAAADGILASVDNATICIGSSVTLTASNTNATPNQNYTYTWTGTAGSGVSSSNGTSITATPTLPGTYTFNLSGVDGGCNAVSSVAITVNPFVAAIAAIDATCNGVSDGSFSLVSSSCGTSPYTYSVDGGAYGAIPNNLSVGAHTVIVKDANGYMSTSLPLTIAQPSIVISNPTVTNASVCQDAASAPVSGASTVSGLTPQTTSFGTNLSSLGTGATTFTVTVPALPANAVITGTTLLLTNVNAINGSYRSEIRVALSGATTLAATQISTLSSGGLISPDPSITIPNLPVSGGSVTLSLTETYDDSGTDATFGNVQIIVSYTTPGTITWWNAATGGTNLGSGSPFETVGTSVLPTTATPGVYTLYAQGQNGACPSPARTPVTVTVKAKTYHTVTVTACNTYTLNASTYTTSGTYTQTLTNAAGCDSIITLNLTINNSTSSVTAITACGSYTWTNGTAYTTSGTYSQLLTNAVGCDSTATLNLTIHQPTTSTVTVNACSSYTWAQNTTTYTTSGSYAVTLAGANAQGCDSTITLNLTINQPTTSTVSVSACSSYTWAANGATYTSSGTHTALLTNAAGCDSTVTLNLTINQPTVSTVTATACGSYTWAENGTTYTTSGSYPVVLAGANAVGCDSTITLNLTIHQPTASTVTVTACESYTWALNGTTYAVSGSYPVVLMGANANGCDSTITLNLTIAQPTTSTVTATACTSYTWAQNGASYTASGMYMDTIANAVGCDSIVTLDLTITGNPTATATDNGDATITASIGSSYQWIDCATNTAIAGATAQTYTATVNGTYAVVVTNVGGCSDTSACVVIDNIGIVENTAANISVYPNPTHSVVTISMTASTAVVEVVDAQGKVLSVSTVQQGGTVDLSTYQTGVYFLRIQTENGSSLERIVKN